MSATRYGGMKLSPALCVIAAHPYGVAGTHMKLRITRARGRVRPQQRNLYPIAVYAEYLQHKTWTQIDLYSLPARPREELGVH